MYIFVDAVWYGFVSFEVVIYRFVEVSIHLAVFVLSSSHPHTATCSTISIVSTTFWQWFMFDMFYGMFTKSYDDSYKCSQSARYVDVALHPILCDPHASCSDD